MFASRLGLLVLLGMSALLGASAVVHPVAPAALVVAAWIGLAGLSSAFFALLGFLVVLYTRPAEFLPALAPLKLAKVGALASLGLFGINQALLRDLRIRRLPLNRWMAVFVFGVLISAALGAGRAYSMTIFQDVFVKILILYVLITNLVDTPARARTFMGVVTACAAFLGAYAIYAKFTGQATIEHSRAGAVGLLGDPNDLAMVLLTGVPFALLALARDRGISRLVWLVALCLTFGGVLVTQSRGGLLGLAAAMYVLLRDRLKSRVLTWIIVGGALLGLVAMAGITARHGLGGGDLDASAQGRLDAWRAGVRMFRFHPLAGVGVGHFPSQYLDYAVNPNEWRAMSAHNTWVQVLGETGLVGVVPFLGLCWLTIRSALRLDGVRKRPGLDGAVIDAQLATAAAVLVCCFFLSQAWNWFLYILFAQVAAIERIHLPPADERADPP